MDKKKKISYNEMQKKRQRFEGKEHKTWNKSTQGYERSEKIKI